MFHMPWTFPPLSMAPCGRQVALCAPHIMAAQLEEAKVGPDLGTRAELDRFRLSMSELLKSIVFQDDLF